MLVGIISDTHDLLRVEAVDALEGVDRILHCGDVCQPSILEELGKLAPVSAVRGNCDQGAWARALPLRDTFELDGILVHALHDLSALDLDPGAAGISVVFSGHSHSPTVEEREGVIYFNPGSAGPRRFDLPVTLGFLDTADGVPALRHETLL